MTNLMLLVMSAAALCAVSAEVVTYENCQHPVADDADSVAPPADNCVVHEVRISPCVEAAENKPCRIKRGQSATIAFDYTPDYACTEMMGRAYWTNALLDLPFLGMDTNACNYTSCPIEAGKSYTYNYNLQISKKFPARTYDVKWKLWGNDTPGCCFITKIKLVK